MEWEHEVIGSHISTSIYLSNICHVPHTLYLLIIAARSRFPLFRQHLWKLKVECVLFFIPAELSKMDSRFADLRRRDMSVSMLRVKQSRRRSQCQKENRERMVNTRRQLDKLPEGDVSSLDVSTVTTNMSTVQKKTQIKATPANSMSSLFHTRASLEML